MNPVIAAALWMGGALVSFLAMAVAGRELSEVLNIFQILFWRSLVGLVVMAALFTRLGWRHARTRRPAVHLARNMVHFAAQYGWFLGIASIPLAQVFAIEFTTPIWTMVLAVLFLGEKITLSRLLAIGLGFAGILIILRPGFATVDVAQLAVLGAALGYALAYVFTKTLVATDSPLTIMFLMTLVQLPLALAASLAGWSWPGGAMWGWVAVVGVSGLTAHYCLSRALQLADATTVTPLDFLRLPLGAAVGLVFYGQAIEIWVLAGAVLIFAGVFNNVRSEAKAAA